MLPSALPQAEKENARSQGNKPAGDCSTGRGKTYELRQTESDGVHREGEVRVMDLKDRIKKIASKFMEESEDAEKIADQMELDCDDEARYWRGIQTAYYTAWARLDDAVHEDEKERKGIGMTYEQVFDRCVIIRETLMAGSGIALEPTLENIEFITMCAEALEEEGESNE